MAKEKVKTTKGTFEVRGIVGGVNGKNFYQEGTTQTGKTKKQISFFVQTCKDNKVYVSLTAFTPENVYFYKAGKDGEASQSKAVPFKDRLKFKEEGFKPIGVNCGLKKTVDKDGNEINKIEYLCDFDAIDYIKENLKDYQFVFVKGNIEYSSYEGKNYRSNVINQISLGNSRFQLSENQVAQLRAEGEDPQVYFVKDLVPYELADKSTAKDTLEVANFKQRLVIDEVNKTDSNSYEVSAYIINYGKEESNVERTVFECEKEALGRNLSKLKPYTAITVSGKIVNKAVTETSTDDDDDGWGTDLTTTVTYEKKYLITFADKDSIDTDTYSEEILAECKRINKEFGSTANKAAKKTSSSDEDDDDSWD